MKKFLKKYCYATMPILVLMIFLYIVFGIKYDSIINNMTSDNLGTIIGMAGTLIGFLFTAMTIFLNLPKDSDVMKNVKSSRHHVIFGKCVICGIFFLTLCIGSWMFNLNSIMTVIFFIEGLVETLICVHYIYTLCIYNF